MALTITLPDELAEKLQAAAEEQQLSVEETAAVILSDALRREDFFPTPEQVASISASSVPVSTAPAPASRPAASTAPVRPTVEATPKATPSRAEVAAATTPAKVVVAAPSVVQVSEAPADTAPARFSVADERPESA